MQLVGDTSNPDEGISIQIEAPLIEGYVLGRSDTSSNYIPDIDLAPFGAQEKGLSRRHAALVHHQGQVHLLDLGSMNGTFVNGKRLQPQVAFALNNGDQLSLANLNIRILQSQ